MLEVFKRMLKGDRNCFQYSIFIIPTNLRCFEIEAYPEFWVSSVEVSGEDNRSYHIHQNIDLKLSPHTLQDFIGNLDSEMTLFLAKNKIPTYILWMGYNHLSYVDKFTCELDSLLKYEEMPFFTRTSLKDGDFLTADHQLTLCSTAIALIPKSPIGPGLLFVVVDVGVLILLLIVVSIVLCILKFKYKYQILKMDFLFQSKRYEEMLSNYYTRLQESVLRGCGEFFGD